MDNKIPPQKIEAWVAAHFDFKKRTGKNGDELVLENPWYHNDNKKFNISLDRAACHDWRGDEWAGPINPDTGKRNCSFIKFVRLYRKCTYREALKEVLGSSSDLSAYLKPNGRITDEKAKRKVAVALPNGVELLTASNDGQARILIKWLKTRGYTTEDIEKNELYHSGMNVYWPYYEFDTLVYWQSRSRLNKRFNFPDLVVLDKKGEIVGETEGSKGDFFYGFDDIEPASYIIITKAIFDKHTLGDQVLASGGAILTTRQVKKIRVLGPKKGIILSPDNDIAGVKSILSNYALLKNSGFPIFCSIPPILKYQKDGEERKSKDWNEIGENVVGFSKVRSIHDEAIRKLNTGELVRLRKLLS